MLDPDTKKCLKCHASCSKACLNCRCIEDPVYSYIDDVNGCKDWNYYKPNC